VCSHLAPGVRASARGHKHLLIKSSTSSSSSSFHEIRPVPKQSELHGIPGGTFPCKQSCGVSHAPFSMANPSGTLARKPILSSAIVLVMINTGNRGAIYLPKESSPMAKTRVLKPLYDLLWEVSQICRKAVSLVRLKHLVLSVNVLQEPWHAKILRTLGLNSTIFRRKCLMRSGNSSLPCPY
jgi:hypothetical protein